MSPWEWIGVGAAAIVLVFLGGTLVIALWQTAHPPPPARPTPVRVPADVDLDDVPPVLGILSAWVTDPRGVDVEAVSAARDAVRWAMPDLAAQLDRLGEAWRRRGTGPGPHPCVAEPHRWGPADGELGLRRCGVCGAIGQVER